MRHINPARTIMNQAEQASKAEAFRALHRGPHLLLLPNAWDAMSARIVASEGFPAIATTSGGLAWALACRWIEDSWPPLRREEQLTEAEAAAASVR